MNRTPKKEKTSTPRKSQPSTPKKEEEGEKEVDGGGVDEEERIDEIVRDEKTPDTQQHNASTESKDRLSE